MASPTVSTNSIRNIENTNSTSGMSLDKDTSLKEGEYKETVKNTEKQLRQK